MRLDQFDRGAHLPAILRSPRVWRRVRPGFRSTTHLARISHQTKCIGAAKSAKSVFARNAYADGRNSPMQTECSTTLFEFAPVEARKVVAGFDGGTMTSNAGGLLLGGADKAIKLIERVAKCFVDRRDPSLIEHSVATLVGQRIFGLALGYEDLNDHDALRHDPLFAVLASKLKARRTDCAPVAGKSTLNRLERSKETPSLYHKIGHDGAAIEKLLIDLFLRISRERPRGNHPRSGRDRRPSARRAGGALLPRLLRLLLLPAVVRFLRRPTAGRQIAQGRHRRERGRGR